MSGPKHTPGPWGWFGNNYGIYLATDHSGRRYVMNFRRMGLQGAQPVFWVNNRMVPAENIVEFEVGDKAARGFTRGKDDPTVYRYDITGIDCPDGRLIAAAPDLLEALQSILSECVGAPVGAGDGETRYVRSPSNGALDKGRAAIAKATGSKP